MARLEYRGETISDVDTIKTLLDANEIPYERWALREQAATDEEVLQLYRPDIERLQRERGYQSVDLVALNPTTPNLDGLLAKFTKEHHHIDDEVRLTIAGEGVFEIATLQGHFLKFTAEPGDLIVIPAYRRHSFYLTAVRAIRCIRLFQTSAGWEAIYEKNFLAGVDKSNLEVQSDKLSL